MSTRLQIRKDNSKNWFHYNPLLSEGEIAVETDTRLVKIGDGTSSWNDLNYVNAADIGPVGNPDNIQFRGPNNSFKGTNDFIYDKENKTLKSVEKINLLDNNKEDGSSNFNVGTGFDGTVNSIVIQSDGKIIIGGAFSTFNGTTGINRIVRLNSDETRDTNFNVGTGFDGTVNSIVIQSDGKIIIGGAFVRFDGITQNRISRLNSDPDPDPDFYFYNYKICDKDVLQSNKKVFQPSIFKNDVMLLTPGNGTAINSFNMPNATTGTVSHPVISSATLRQSLRRTTSSGSGSIGFRSNVHILSMSKEDDFGFFAHWRFRCDSITVFIGLAESTTNAFAYLNCIGINALSTDSNFRIIHNTGISANNRTILDLGSNFSKFSFIDFFIYHPPFSDFINWKVINIATKAISSGKILNNLPSTLLARHEFVSHNFSHAMDLYRVYIERFI